MARKKLTAAEYLNGHDAEMRVILDELLENAAKANVRWAAAQRHVSHDPDLALTELVEAMIALDIPVRIERADALRILNRVTDLLDQELPDNDESAPATK